MCLLQQVFYVCLLMLLIVKISTTMENRMFACFLWHLCIASIAYVGDHSQENYALLLDMFYMVAALLHVLCVVSIIQTWLSFNYQNIYDANGFVLKPCMMEVCCLVYYIANLSWYCKFTCMFLILLLDDCWFWWRLCWGERIQFLILFSMWV